MKKKKLGKKWLILGIPTGIIMCGLLIIGIFFWDLAKQTVLLSHSVLTPNNTTVEYKTFKNETWPSLPKPGESLGTLSIDSLDLSYPVVQGTHEKELKKGIGHFAGSTLPGQGGHVLLSGHHNTVFVKLENLEKGDIITFSTPYGDFKYEAVEFQIVDAKDVSVAVPKDYETLTLTTCYPFNFVGDAPERFVVYTKFLSHTLKAA